MPRRNYSCPVQNGTQCSRRVCPGTFLSCAALLIAPRRSRPVRGRAITLPGRGGDRRRATGATDGVARGRREDRGRRRTVAVLAGRREGRGAGRLRRITAIWRTLGRRLRPDRSRIALRAFLDRRDTRRRAVAFRGPVTVLARPRRRHRRCRAALLGRARQRRDRRHRYLARRVRAPCGKGTVWSVDRARGGVARELGG